MFFLGAFVRRPAIERRTAAELDVTRRAVTTSSESRSSLPVHKKQRIYRSDPAREPSPGERYHNRLGGYPAAGDYGVT